MSLSNSLSEAHKLRLLQHMGITLYVPRYRLPGAAPSRVSAELANVRVLRAAPAAQPGEHRQPPHFVDTSSSPTPPPIQSLRAMVGDVREVIEASRAPKIALDVESPPSVAPPASEVRTAPLSRALEPEVRFHAQLYAVAPELAVLSFAPALARQQLPERERALLQNVLRWLGIIEPNMRNVRSFQWPIPNLAGGGITLAGAGLRAFLDQAQREDKFARLVVFGDLLREAMHADGGMTDFHATYSLQELCAVPALKRECWQSLLPLHQALQPLL